MADPADIVIRLRAVLHDDRSVELMNREAADEIERLRAERDEARRYACIFAYEAHGQGVFIEELECKSPSPETFAKNMKWDCYKDRSDD